MQIRGRILAGLALMSLGCAGESELPLAPSQAMGGKEAPFGALRRATAAFHDIDAALAAGYAAPVPAECIEMPGVGAMGIHYANLGLASDLAIDPLRPEVLLYLPKSSGGLRLVGVEYFEVALVLTPNGPAPWFSSSPPPYPFLNPAPSVFGEVFDGPMAGHDAAMPWHYDKHVWVWAPNPAGMFAPFNPSLSCPTG